MDMIIAILLWLSTIAPNSSHTQAEYDAYVQQHQAVIDSVQQNSQLQQDIWDDHGIYVPTVIVGY